MHEIAATVGSASIILIGIIFGIFYNQGGLDRLEVGWTRSKPTSMHFTAVLVSMTKP